MKLYKIDGFSKEIRLCALADFLYQYNHKWNEDWTFDMDEYFVYVFKKDALHRSHADGHFSNCLNQFLDKTFCILANIKATGGEVKFFFSL